MLTPSQPKANGEEYDPVLHQTKSTWRGLNKLVLGIAAVLVLGAITGGTVGAITQNAASSEGIGSQTLSTPTPSMTPSSSPTTSPSRSPATSQPTQSPTTSRPTESPSTSSPSKSPSSSRPSNSPSTSPSSSQPSSTPTTQPSHAPSYAPSSSSPSAQPSISPTTSQPSRSPSTTRPSRSPSRSPTTTKPSRSPSTSQPSASPSTSQPSSSPSFAPTDTPGARAACIGYAHGCAVLWNYQVKCWGRNLEGQLGDGTFTSRHNAVKVPGLVNVMKIACSTYGTCALLSTGGVRCWGSNADGLLGSNVATSIASRNTPQTVAVIDSAIDISCGQVHCCLISSPPSNEVWCWGRNNAWSLLTYVWGGSTQSSIVPVLSNLPPASSVSCGKGNTCVIRADDSVYACVGNGAYGQLPTPTESPTSTPSSDGTTASIIAVTGFNMYFINAATGIAKTAGTNGFGQLGTGFESSCYGTCNVAGSPVGILQFAGGDYHTCFLYSDKTARCCGNPDYGALGHETNPEFSTAQIPRTVTGSFVFSSLAVGSGATKHTCGVIDVTGAILCWGTSIDGSLGQLDDDGAQTKVPLSTRPVVGI